MTGIIGFLLASYLSLVRSQNISTMRSRAWNSTIPLVEAGIEDALTHINVNGATNIATHGWWANGDGTYSITRQLGDGSYDVTMGPGADGTYTNGPTITAEGFAPAPIMLSSAPFPFFAQVGGDYQTRTTTEEKTVARRVRVTTRRDALFSRGMVAKGQIDMSGNNVRTDSFDSADPLYSNNGQYDGNRAKDNGDVATNSGLVNSLAVGNANIYGRVATGPGGSVSVGAGGGVGSKAWQDINDGVQPGWSSDDMNVDFPEVRNPFENGGYTGISGGATVTNVTITYISTTNNTTTYPLVTSPGTVYTNSATTVTTTKPSTGYLGTIRTNLADLTTTSYPSSPMGPVNTNTTPTTSRTFPAAGTYLGSVITREVTTGRLSDRGTYYDYARVTGYTYPAITGYTWLRITSYDYVLSNPTTNNIVETYDLVIPGGSWEVPTLEGKILVTGHATVRVTGDISLTGQEKIVIRTNASLNLFGAGANVDLGGNGVLNETGNAANFTYYGMPSNTRLSFSGNAAFVGAIYAPNADFTLGGGGATTFDFVGASITKSVRMNGHFNFHYDENLAKVGPPRGYLVTTWNEIAPTRVGAAGSTSTSPLSPSGETSFR